MKKSTLLSLLDDEDVQAKIKRIVVENAPKQELVPDEKHGAELRVETLEKEVEMLSNLIKQLKALFSDNQDKVRRSEAYATTLTKEKQQLSEQLNSLNRELEDKQASLQATQRQLAQMQQENQQLSEKLRGYEAQFEQELAAYDLYNGLSEKTKASLKGIFKSDDLAGFLACGVQEKNISSFWEYAKNEVIEGKNPDHEALVKIFHFFLTRYLMAYPLFQQQAVSIGEKFDTARHIKDSHSASSGKISQVLLPGWENTKTNKVMGKSLVRVG